MTTTTVGQNANIKSVKISLSVSKWLLPIFQGAPRTSASIFSTGSFGSKTPVG